MASKAYSVFRLWTSHIIRLRRNQENCKIAENVLRSNVTLHTVDHSNKLVVLPFLFLFYFNPLGLFLSQGFSLHYWTQLPPRRLIKRPCLLKLEHTMFLSYSRWLILPYPPLTTYSRRLDLVSNELLHVLFSFFKSLGHLNALAKVNLA